MTSAFTSLSSSSSDSAIRLPNLSVLNSKLSTTFIIQPPTLCQVKQSSLLSKRCKPAELGDLLMKKIKSQTANSSEDNSQQQSPALKRFEDQMYESPSSSKGLEALESTSMVDEIESPSIKSFCDETERKETQNSFGNILMAQRSISTPLVSNPLSLRSFKTTVNDGHRQIQHALKVLEKKMMIDQQATALKEILLKIQRTQEPLNIPPLITPSDSTSSTVKKGKITIRMGDEEQEVIYGDVEYPFLSQSMAFDEVNAGKGFPSSSLTLRNTTASSKSNNDNDSLSSSESSNTFRYAKNMMMDLDDCLTATRTETQRSESELESEKTKGKKGRGKRLSTTKTTEVKRGQKKEKTTRAKREKSPLLSPVRTSKSKDRKKNKWQLNEEAIESNTTKQSSEKKASKVKWAPNEEKTIFFDGLRNLLNNVDDSKAVTLP